MGLDVGTNVSFTWPSISQILSHAILPAFTIIITSVGGWILTMRNNMITTLNEDYVRMARAKGLPSFRIMTLYAGRNAILPNITGFALSLGFVLSGALLTEIVFDYPGIGYLLYQAVTGEDYPLIQTIFLFITVAVLIAVLAADVANALLDPRTRDSR
jgi:peptide/nickel transport system permease protein